VATGPWAAFRCALAGARNPLAERAAAVAPPDFRVDTERHLLLQRSGEPVSIAPASSLGPLESRRFIVVHFSAGPQQGVEAYFQRPDAVASVHVMIARDGSVKQMVPFDFAAHHAGPSRWKGVEGLNRHSIGIDLENWGQLKSREGTWQAWTGAAVPAAEVLTTGDPPQHWQRYTDAQLLSFAKVACALRQAYPSIEDIVGHEQVSAGRKNDPGPAFPLQRMQAIVLGPQAAGPR
jgi:N-acetylmuramoyl-L-alanine amidase